MRRVLACSERGGCILRRMDGMGLPMMMHSREYFLQRIFGLQMLLKILRVFSVVMQALFYRFPNAKFVSFTRIHCKVYRRGMEYYDLLQSGKIDEDIENELFL